MNRLVESVRSAAICSVVVLLVSPITVELVFEPWAGTSEAMISRIYRHRLRRVAGLTPADD